MIIVGLTGGIGSGKTTVAKQFKTLGIPVYIADNKAKKLIRKSKVIKRKLIQLFGDKAYLNGELNKGLIADIIFNDKEYLHKMNAIIHPAVARDFEKWVLKQTSPYVVKEVAILFENEGYKLCDYVISVIAPKSLRIQRVLERDKTTKLKIEAVMKNQWSDEEKAKRSDFVIENIDISDTKNQVSVIHKMLKKNHKII